MSFKITDNILEEYTDDDNIKWFAIPEGVTGIRPQAFRKCRILERLYIPRSLINMKALLYCAENLKEIIVDEQNPVYASRDGVLYDKQFETVICFPSRREFYIPPFVKHIGDHAFKSGQKLNDRNSLRANIETLSIPESVVSIGRAAFWGYRSLKRLIIPESLKECAYTAFDSFSGRKMLVTYRGITFHYQEGFYFASEENSHSVGDVLKLIDTKNFDAVADQNAKHEIAVSLFLKNSHEPEACRWIQEHVPEIFRLLTNLNHIEQIHGLLASHQFVTSENIDSLIQQAIDDKAFEIQLMLMDYKNQHLDYADSDEEIKKKFAL